MTFLSEIFSWLPPVSFASAEFPSPRSEGDWSEIRAPVQWRMAKVPIIALNSLYHWSV